MTPAQLVADTTGARVLDVREPDEIANGRIAGSPSVPLGQLTARLGS